MGAAREARRDAFADGVLTCHGVECGAGLSCVKYAFELGDGGLSVIELGSHQQYMVGLAQDEHIADPVGYVCDLHFPGQPPGLSLGEFWRTSGVRIPSMNTNGHSHA